MLLIDGDIICYRVVFSPEAESVDDLLFIADQYIRNIRAKADPKVKDYRVYLSGKGNFRNDIAVTKPYKGNRPPEKPEHLDLIRQHLLAFHPSELSENEEADDRIAIAATEGGASQVICSIDKDFDQVPGWHYNFVKDKRYCVSEAEGLLSFYCQILVGDRIDNVEGVKGIGPVKALKALQGKTEAEMFRTCSEMLGSRERAAENGSLLWLRRHEGQQWTPPSA